MAQLRIGCVVMAAGNARRFGENKLAVQVQGQQDQAQRDQGQQADHHREPLQEFQVVITHIASYGEWRGRPQLAPNIETVAPASEAGSLGRWAFAARGRCRVSASGGA